MDTIIKDTMGVFSTELLSDLLEVEIWSPNHKVRDPWRFIIYNGQNCNKTILVIFVFRIKVL